MGKHRRGCYEDPELPPQAFRVLQMLVERPGELISREEFHRAVAGRHVR